MSIREFFIDRDEPAHLVDQLIHYMEGIVDTSAERDNRMGQFFVADFSVGGSDTLLVYVYTPFLHG